MRSRGLHQVYLGVGSNIQAEQNLPESIHRLSQHIDVLEVSNVWETPPEGSRGVNFLNAAMQVCTILSSGLLKSLILRPIEVQMGRVRTANKNAPRPIDLDILVFDGTVVDPKVWTQAFVAVPLAELLPDLANPQTGETVRAAADRLAMGKTLRKREDVRLFSHKEELDQPKIDQED